MDVNIFKLSLTVYIVPTNGEKSNVNGGKKGIKRKNSSAEAGEAASRLHYVWMIMGPLVLGDLL